jgi:hypothetical protein
MTLIPVRLGSTYRVIVPFYALSDGTTLMDLDALPTLQMYDTHGTAVGSAITCTKDSTGIYHGDIEFDAVAFHVGSEYIWKMYGLSGTKDQNQTGYFTVLDVV